VLGRHDEAPPLVWLAFDAGGERLAEALHRAGRPVRYAYVPRPWPLHHYQTMFAAAPGSAEMASAGRPFTVQTVRALRDRGIGLATISLHAGLSTYGDPAVDRCRAAGGRVVAVGTTVVRALETAAAEGGGKVRAGSGVTRLRIGPGHRLLAVDGLLTGLHEPEASHLDLLGAFVNPEILARAYTAALDAGYLWHEFGDACLVVSGSAELPQTNPVP
jgi:S-adenosylmethionine:tRNA ribosyltransferase-isomerase